MALVGVAVNIIAAWVLAKANRSSLNVEGAFKHIITDLYGFIGTVVAGIVILTTGFTRADAIASLIVVGLMVHAAWGLLRDSGRVLLEAAPEGIDLADLRQHLLDTEHVLQVHDLHVWVVTSSLPAVSAHVVIDDSCFSDGHGTTTSRPSPRVSGRTLRCGTLHLPARTRRPQPARGWFPLKPHEEGVNPSAVGLVVGKEQHQPCRGGRSELGQALSSRVKSSAYCCGVVPPL